MAKKRVPVNEKTIYDLVPGWYVIRPTGVILKGIDGFPKRFPGKNSALDAACYVCDGAEGCAVLFVPNNFAWGE